MLLMKKFPRATGKFFHMIIDQYKFFFSFMFAALHFFVNGVGVFNEVVEDVLEEESGVVGERGNLSK
jgi:hypothetical protein